MPIFYPPPLPPVLSNTGTCRCAQAWADRGTGDAPLGLADKLGIQASAIAELPELVQMDRFLAELDAGSCAMPKHGPQLVRGDGETGRRGIYPLTGPFRFGPVRPR